MQPWCRFSLSRSLETAGLDFSVMPGRKALPAHGAGEPVIRKIIWFFGKMTGMRHPIPLIQKQRKNSRDIALTHHPLEDAHWKTKRAPPHWARPSEITEW